jgi:predicted metal-binding protein
MTNENILTQINSIPGVVEVITRLTTMETLYKYYKPVEVEGYCSACPNYGRIWSCPPFDFDVTTYLAPYEHVLIIGVKTTDFEATRRRFGDILKGISEIKKIEEIEVLIAGNCYHCEVCTKTTGEPCILNEGTKYSLEALGFHVGDICEHILDAPLDWSGSDGTFMTVGAILSNSKEMLEAMI